MKNDRLRILIISIFVLWVGLAARTFQIQVIEGDVYSERAESQASRRQIWKPERGRIVDRNGYTLADNLVSWGDVGREYKRVYPEGSLASQVLGYTGKDGQGLQGLEYAFDDKLKGVDGYFHQMVTVKKKAMPGLEKAGIAPIAGLDMVLTIDRDYQEIMEQALAKGVKQLDADRGSALLLDPNTGEILAMSSYPSFNPNTLSLAKGAVIRNDLITLVFEPGSTFKAITAAAALEEHAVDPNLPIDSEGGRMELPNGDVIRDTKDHGVMNMTDAMAYSSNVVFAKIASQVGDEKFYRIVRAFGFGSTTMIELPGEESGTLKPVDRWSARTVLTMAFGHEMMATPLQMVMAYAAIANGGELLQPRLIREWRSPKTGKVVQSSDRKLIRRVISQETASQIRNMLREVVARGTATNIKSDILDFGGKTGTAEKYNVKTGRYDRNSMISSFIGMVPAGNPRFLCMVVIDEPRTAHVGAYTAGPVFKEIMENIYHSPKVSPTPFQLHQAQAKLPCDDISYLGLSLNASKQKAKEFQCPIRIMGDGDRIVSQKMVGDTLWLRANPIGTKVMPDLRGLPLRDALEALGPARSQVVVSGKGWVQEQEPMPLDKLGKEQKIRLVLKEGT